MLKKILGRKIKKFCSMQTAFVVINIIYILSLVLITLISKKEAMVNVFAYLLIFMVYKAVENLLLEINKEKSKTIKPSKRFTHKNDDTGAIEIRKEDWQGAILYLYELENQIALKR